MEKFKNAGAIKSVYARINFKPSSEAQKLMLAAISKQAYDADVPLQHHTCVSDVPIQ